MYSVYWAVGIATGIFAWINWTKYKKGIVAYDNGTLCIFYVITRVIPFLMLTTHHVGMFRNAGFDILLLALLVLSMRKYEKNIRNRMIGIYLMNPFVILSVVSGGFTRMLFIVNLFIWSYIIWNRLQLTLTRKRWLAIYPCYLLLSYGLMGILLSKDVYYESYKQCISKDGYMPVRIIGSTMLVLYGFYRIIQLLYEFKKNPKEEEPIAYLEHEDILEETTITKKHLGKMDYIFLFAITIVSGIIGFYQLGSTKAPESYIELNTKKVGNNELTLDFGREVTISKISIYLGHQSKRTISLSKKSDFSKEWKVFLSKKNIQSVFCWNDIDVNQSLRYLGIVSLDSSAYIHELIILDEKGNRIVPINEEYYSNLFDEQEDYPAKETYYYRTMFDEVYHARTAYELVHDCSIYEVSHPPLGKILISIGIRLFGMNPFGWRVIGCLLGTLMVPLMYLFAWEFSKNTKVSIFTSLLLNFEFMHFTLERIATIDIEVAFFILLMFYTMFCFVNRFHDDEIIMNQGTPTEKRHILMKELFLLILCGCATGCAIATKWTGVYAAVGIAVIFFVALFSSYHSMERFKQGKKRIFLLFATCVVAFIVIPVCIYILSYIPYTQVDSSKGLIKTVIDNVVFMFQYHKDSIFDHPYSSEWYEWIMMKRPLLDALTLTSNETISTVSTLINPIVAWGGIIAFLHNIYLWRCKKNQTSRYLCFGYIAMLLPWLFIHRTVFIYQYFGCVLVLVLLVGHSISVINHKKQHRYMVLILVSAILLFVVFYPVISGRSVSIHYIRQILKWFTTWPFV